jgi:hypothetical protein
MGNIDLMVYVVGLLLGIVGVFLLRLLAQIDKVTAQFNELIVIVGDLKTTLVEHKGDVMVIKEQISTHARDIEDINKIWDRMRNVENKVAIIESKRV